MVSASECDLQQFFCFFCGPDQLLPRLGTARGANSPHLFCQGQFQPFPRVDNYCTLLVVPFMQEQYWYSDQRRLQWHGSTILFRHADIAMANCYFCDIKDHDPLRNWLCQCLCWLLRPHNHIELSVFAVTRYTLYKEMYIQTNIYWGEI